MFVSKTWINLCNLECIMPISEFINLATYQINITKYHKFISLVLRTFLVTLFAKLLLMNVNHNCIIT